MIAFLFSFISCVFVPFDISEIISLELVSKETLLDNISKNPIVVAMSCPKDHYIISHAFTNSAPLFPEAVFVIVEREDLAEVAKVQELPSEPLISIFKKGLLDVTVGPIYKEDVLLYMLDLYIYEKRPTLQDNNLLVAELGSAPLTVITSEDEFSSTFSIVKKSALKSGPIDIVSLSKHAAKELKLEPKTCAVYRSVDQFLEPIACTEESILQRVKPTFDDANVEKLEKSDKPCFIFHLPEHRSPQVKDLMFKLGSTNTEFDFYFVHDKESCKLIDKYYPPKFCQKHNVAVIDFKSHKAYDLNAFYPKGELDGKLDLKRLYAYTNNFIAEYKKNAAPYYYQSEPVQRPSKSPLKRIVGRNYKELVEEEDTDVLVLYLKPQSNVCAKAFGKFRSIADDALECDEPSKDGNETTAENLTKSTCNRDLNNHTKFYFIIATDNYFEGGYPTYADEPAIVLYSASDKKNPRIVLGTEQADIQLHLRLFAKYPVTFSKEYNLGTMDHLEEQIKVIESARGKMSNEESKLLDDTIKRVKEEFAKSNNVKPEDPSKEEL